MVTSSCFCRWSKAAVYQRWHSWTMPCCQTFLRECTCRVPLLLSNEVLQSQENLATMRYGLGAHRAAHVHAGVTCSCRCRCEQSPPQCILAAEQQHMVRSSPVARGCHSR